MFFILAILLIVSFFFDVNKYIVKSVPINYERLTENSGTNKYYYVDSIVSCSKMFEIEEQFVVNNQILTTSPLTTSYYLAKDKNGFEFFIQVDSNDKDYLESRLTSGDQNFVLHGTLTTLPTDFNYFPSATEENILAIVNGTFTEKKDEIISFVNQYKMLKAYSTPPKTLSVNDRINPLYVTLIVIRLSLIATFVGLLILKKYYTTQITDIVERTKISYLH